jgi:hypothetical protein
MVGHYAEAWNKRMYGPTDPISSQSWHIPRGEIYKNGLLIINGRFILTGIQYLSAKHKMYAHGQSTRCRQRARCAPQWPQRILWLSIWLNAIEQPTTTRCTTPLPFARRRHLASIQPLPYLSTLAFYKAQGIIHLNQFCSPASTEQEPRHFYKAIYLLT